MSLTILLTGASSGVGAACARHLASRGHRVFGTSRKARGPSPDADGIEWLTMDVGNEASVLEAVEAMRASAGEIDALVCNAGMGIFGSVEEVSLEAAQRQLDTNFFGVLRTLRAVLPHMRSAGRGRIVLVGSLAGRAPIPFQAHYSASKAAVDALAMSLRNEVRELGIHVSLLEPGDINTPFNEAMHWEEGASSAYEGPIRRCETVIRESLPKAPGPEIVARTLEKALCARRPRVRYTVGPDSILVPLGRRLLPDRFVLKLIRDHFEL